MVSIVMPAYNEAEIIEQTVEEWHREVNEKLPGSELIVVDDCSTDGTGAVLAGLERRFPALRAVRPARNGGHGKALRFGFQHAGCEFIFQTDSDRQHLPREFWQLWERREDCDFVFGIRSTRQDGAFRVAVTRTMRLLNLVMWGSWIRDANCPFRLMRSKALASVLDRIPGDSFIPMVMVSIVARKMHFRIGEVAVTHLPRTGGQQSLKGMVKWFHVGRRCFYQLLRLRLSMGDFRQAPDSRLLGASSVAAQPEAPKPQS